MGVLFLIKIRMSSVHMRQNLSLQRLTLTIPERKSVLICKVSCAGFVVMGIVASTNQVIALSHTLWTISAEHRKYLKESMWCNRSNHSREVLTMTLKWADGLTVRLEHLFHDKGIGNNATELHIQVVCVDGRHEFAAL